MIDYHNVILECTICTPFKVCTVTAPLYKLLMSESELEPYFCIVCMQVFLLGLILYTGVL